MLMVIWCLGGQVLTSGGFEYTKYNQGSGGFHVLWFKVDGTYEGYALFAGSHLQGGSVYYRENGNWFVPVKGTVPRNYTENNIQFGDGTVEADRHYVNHDRTYAFEEKDGKKGIHLLLGFCAK